MLAAAASHAVESQDLRYVVAGAAGGDLTASSH